MVAALAVSAVPSATSADPAVAVQDATLMTGVVPGHRYAAAPTPRTPTAAAPASTIGHRRRRARGWPIPARRPFVLPRPRCSAPANPPPGLPSSGIAAAATTVSAPAGRDSEVGWRRLPTG